MQETKEIFRFNDAVDFLNYEFESKRIKNSRFSLRAWARQLGYENPSFLSHILKKDRSLKIDVAEKFTANLKLTGDAKKYFELLVLLKNSKTVDEKKIYLDILESLRPRSEKAPQSLHLDAFRVISDWYHTAILELVELSDFKNDLEWIRARLGNEVSGQNISKAIQRLLKLELLEETSRGKLGRVKDNPVLLENFIPSDAIRHFHKQMIEKAKSAIEEQDIKERDIRGSMISVRTKDFSKIQEVIRKAHAEIIKYSCAGNGEELYQFNTQFFRITRKKGTV
ncbi:MAG TPA: TIGR02147 family protein [Pseudobdellovibrionaceae bacterium]|jgi:uncharacterized protein (TIGR02147 family)